MTGRAWLVVMADRAPASTRSSRSVELRPIPDELALRDRVALICWPDRGVDREPVLAGTATVTRIFFETGVVRLRHRVSPVRGHGIPVASLGPRLAAARGWTIARRPDLLDAPRLIGERDFDVIEGALLATARAFGPPARRPAHARPRTPGRRALTVGRMAWGR